MCQSGGMPICHRNAGHPIDQSLTFQEKCSWKKCENPARVTSVYQLALSWEVAGLVLGSKLPHLPAGNSAYYEQMHALLAATVVVYALQ